MILTNYNGQPLYLLDIGPDWNSPVRATISLLNDNTVGLSNREARRPYSETLRWRLQFPLTATGMYARRMVTALRTYQKEPVAVPLWLARVDWSQRGTAKIRGGISLVYKEDWSHWEIFEGVEPGWPAADDNLVPLLVGRLEKRAVRWASGDCLQFDVDFVEASPANWAITPTAFAFTAGPKPSNAYAANPAVFPFYINVKTDNEAVFTIPIHRDQIGFGRQPLEVIYAQANARERTLDHLIEGDDIAKLLYFFLRHGTGDPFWVSDWTSNLVLSANVAVNDVLLQAEDTAGVKDGDWLAFLRGTDIVSTARVLAHTDNDVTIDAPVGAWKKSEPLITQLLLTRFQKPTLSIDWISGQAIECKLPLREVSEEYTPAADEVLGVSLGLLPARCLLYEFSRVLDGNTYYERYTSFERDLALAGTPYPHQMIGDREIRQGIALDEDEVNIDFPALAGSAMVLAATLALESPLYLTIRMADVNGPNAVNAQVIFFGEVTNAGLKGSVISARTASGGSMFDWTIPRPMFQPSCNNILFDTGCALAKADFKFSAVVQNPGAVGYPFEFVLQTLAGVGARAIAALPVSADYFAGGWINFGAGANFQTRPILTSTNPVAGVLTVTLDRDPKPYPAVGYVVALYPGCDNLFATCQGKFNNTDNFIGHYLMPLANPSLIGKNQTGAGGKK